MIYCIQFYLRYGIIEVPKLKLEENKIIQSFINVGVKREQIMLLEYSIDVEFDGGHYNYMILNP